MGAGSLGSSIKWTADDASLVTFVSYGSSSPGLGATASIKSQNSGSVNISARTDQEDLDTQNLSIYSLVYEHTAVGNSTYTDDGLTYGWSQDYITYFTLDNGESVPDEMGVNEYFDKYTPISIAGINPITYISLKPKPVNTIDNKFNDHYSWYDKHYLTPVAPHPLPSSDPNGSTVLYTLDQTYSAGSTTPQDGLFITKHTLCWTYSGVTWINQSN